MYLVFLTGPPYQYSSGIHQQLTIKSLSVCLFACLSVCLIRVHVGSLRKKEVFEAIILPYPFSPCTARVC